MFEDTKMPMKKRVRKMGVILERKCGNATAVCVSSPLKKAALYAVV
jgi:hypothetical protein